MQIGAPKEIKNNEYRVGLTPSSVAELTHAGHGVLIETGAGEGAGLSDEDYAGAGAREDIFRPRDDLRAELVVKVKEPQPQEVALLRPDADR